MCGITGKVNFDHNKTVPEELILHMCRVMRHRGPDDVGTYCRGPVGLGMVRLSIIDLSTGHQPIGNEDGTIWVICNGEIYNYKEIRQILVSRGHTFKTESDTEVIVHAYEEYGVNCLQEFNGMFGIALWDSNKQRLFLARDRLGVKPLFWSICGKSLLFGSEIKTILQEPTFNKHMDYQALSAYLACWYIPGPRTIFAGIQKLDPGNYLVVENGQVGQPVQYWDLKYPAVNRKVKETDVLAELDSRIEDAVRLCLRSDVPLGAFLSGGLDSTTVVAYMSKLLDQPVKTFSIGFAERSYSELAEARAVADWYHTDHYEIEVKASSADLIRKIIGYYDEPAGDYSAIPTYLVSQFAKQKVTVVLTGDGGDEVFAGYPTHKAYRYAEMYRNIPGWIRNGLISPLVKNLPTSFGRISFDYMAKRFIAGAEMPLDRGHFQWKLLFGLAKQAELLVPEVLEQIGNYDPFETFARHFDKVKTAAPLNQLLYADTKTFLLDDNQTKLDRMTMAHAVEARVPLLDYTLVEWVSALPPELKIKGGVTKYLLRALNKKTLPPQVLTMKKKGFTPPIPIWLRGELKPMLMEVLSTENIRKVGLFRPEYVQKMMKSYFDGQADYNRELWALMVFMLWHEQYLE